MICNYRLSRARPVSENAFGVMSNRFRCILGNIQLDPDVATEVVLACCVLHNFLLQRCGKGYIPDVLANNAPEAPTAACNLIPIYPALGRKTPNVAKQVRETLADYFMGLGAALGVPELSIASMEWNVCMSTFLFQTLTYYVTKDEFVSLHELWHLQNLCFSRKYA